MTFGTSMEQPSGVPISDDWRTVSDELLQGLVHALNNRVAALSAFVELAKLGDDEGDPLTVLSTEIAQLHQVNALFGLLPERRAEAEALDLREVLDDAIRLHEHHPRLRGERVVVTSEGAPGVVRAPRWALVRAMVMLVHIAKRAAESAHGRGGAVLHIRGDEAAVGVHVATTAEPAADLLAVADRCGGSVRREHDDLVLRLPSLRELRRRERVAREDSPPS
jgi:hypothetical protein